MWFRKGHRPERKLRAGEETHLGAFLESSGVGNSGAIPPVSYYVDDVPDADPPNAEPNIQSARMELRVRYQHLKQFEPERRRLARNLVIGTAASNQVYSAYNYLRTQVIHRLQENGWNTVAVTSPSRESGNTLTAINLAISIARNYNYTVLLVELDLVNPSFGRLLGFEQRQGIVDHLLYDVPISEIMLDPGIDGLVVIPAGSPVTNSSELLSSPKMTRLVEELKLRYKQLIVLFDLPSVLSVDDAMAFSPFVDCALLVVEEGETRVNDVRRALDYLRSTKILGVVLNRSNQAASDGKMTSR
jgi:protein-tyrosine kinase